MSDNATEYLVTESTKKLGNIITQLDALRDDFAKVNMETIAEIMPYQIVTFHDMLSKLESNLQSTRLISLIMSLTSNGNDE